MAADDPLDDPDSARDDDLDDLDDEASDDIGADGAGEAEGADGADDDIVVVERIELDDDELSYDFAPWAGESRELLGSLLTSEGVRHAWQGTTLVVPIDAEAEVDRLIDDVQAVAAGSLDPSRERVVYEVGSWSAALQTSLVESLTVADIPYEWDEGGDLVIYADDEEAVERIFDAMPDPDDEDAIDADGVDVNRAIFDLWQAAGTLAKHPDDAAAVLSLVDTTDAIERLSVPFGFEPAVWRSLCSEAGEIRDALEAGGDGESDADSGMGDGDPDADDAGLSSVDDDELKAMAARLAAQLRRYV